MDVWACMRVHAQVCFSLCVREQVAGIFEDDSRGLTHARLNKAALWWSLCDTLSLGLQGLSPPSHTHVHNTHSHTASFPWWCSLSDSEGCTLIAVDTCEVCVWSNDDTLDTTLVLTLLIPVITSAFYTQPIFPLITTILLWNVWTLLKLEGVWWSSFESRLLFCKFIQVVI